jgi:hypothetical protein
MNSEAFSEWLGSLSVSQRIRALTLIYSQLTVCARQLFLPDMPKGKEKAIVNMLHGVNELHHTLANQLRAYAYEEEGYLPKHLSQQLLEIANQYGIGGLLTSAVDFAGSRNLSTKT